MNLKTELGKLLYGPFELSNNLHGISSNFDTKFSFHSVSPNIKKQPNFRIIRRHFWCRRSTFLDNFPDFIPHLRINSIRNPYMRFNLRPLRTLFICYFLYSQYFKKNLSTSNQVAQTVAILDFEVATTLSSILVVIIFCIMQFLY